MRQLIEMGTRPFAFLDRCHREFGNIFTIRLFGLGPLVFMGDQQAIQWIFSQPRDAFTHFNDQVGLVIGDRSVLFMDGEEHRQERRLLMPIFHGDRMRTYGDIMCEATARTVDEWPEGVALTIRSSLQRITLEVICRCVFGTAQGPRLARLQDAVEHFLDAALTPLLYAASIVVPPVRIRRYFDRHSTIDREAGALTSVGTRVLPWRRLASYRAEISRAVYEEISLCRKDPGTSSDSILAMLVATCDETGTGLGDREIHDEILTLLVAGHETTATTLAWGLHHILRTQPTQEQLYQELRTEFPDGVVAPTRIGKLPYLKAVLNETLRLTPIAVAVTRRLKNPAHLAGHDIPAGTVVAPSIYVAHRSAHNWERPDDFAPERFVDNNASPFMFLPFGGGARRCVGAEFARYQLAIVLGQLLLMWRFEPVKGFKVKPYMRGATVAPSPHMSVLAYRR